MSTLTEETPSTAQTQATGEEQRQQMSRETRAAEEARQQILDSPLLEWEMQLHQACNDAGTSPIRALKRMKNTFARLGIKTVGELARRSAVSLIDQKGLGLTQVNIIHAFLATFNLRLQPDPRLARDPAPALRALIRFTRKRREHYDDRLKTLLAEAKRLGVEVD